MSPASRAEVFRAALLISALGLPLAASSSPPPLPTGIWWAEGGAAQVEIERCDDALCGRVIWLRSPFDEHGCPVLDEANPDPALRDRELVGVELLLGLRPTAGDPSEWGGGEIYDPTSGRHYKAVLRLDGPDRLLVRGYLGIRLLGRTTTWHRVGAEPVCREPA